MLCDELKNYEHLASDCRIGQIVIPKEKVDEATAELKARISELEKENAELKEKCERRMLTAKMWKNKYEELLK